MSPLTPFDLFSDLTVKLSKINQAFLNSLEYELDNHEIYEINVIQALMLKNIGDTKTNITKATSRGYYLGKNMSYNISALLSKGYLLKEIDNNDERSVCLILTKKGLKVLSIIDNAISSQVRSLTSEGVNDNFIENVNGIIDKMQIVLDKNARI